MSLKLKFDPKTIEHLGVKMYSTLPPALAEIISNAYDADASEVVVEFREQNGTPTTITITDNGIGMSLHDIQTKFLVIGRNRRQIDGDKPSVRFQRLPTGKKGLGKLALFGIAKSISVDTIQNNLRNRFHLNYADLLASNEVYKPTIDITDRKTTSDSKTIIQLNELKRRSSFDLEALADSLARVFIVESNFQIKLKDNKGREIIISEERRYGKFEQQFTWSKDDLILKDSPYFEKVQEVFLTTGKKPILPASGLRGIAVFSRGKLVNAPEYFSDSTSSHFHQYLTGWIKADFIDLLDEDVISTNRQALNWDHPEMTEFRDFLSEIIAKARQDWRKKRSNKKNQDIQKVTGINKERWFSTLPRNVRVSVEAIVKNMGENEEVSETFAPVVQALYAIIPEYPLLHWRCLHASIKDGVSEYYKNRQYGHAADQGVKLYEESIRRLSDTDKYGTDIASVFDHHYDATKKTITKPPTLPINDLSTESLRNIQAGQGALTRGLMQGFRNPVNHTPISTVVPNLITELDCLNILSLISYLANKLEYADNSSKS